MRKNTNNDPRKTQAKRIGSRIREIRTMRGMSQDEFGQLVGLSADRVQQYENGFRTPKPELLKKYAGFTYYPNVISFGGSTNLAIPALYGGYEYTPTELNHRTEDLLVD